MFSKEKKLHRRRQYIKNTDLGESELSLDDLVTRVTCND